MRFEVESAQAEPLALGSGPGGLTDYPLERQHRYLSGITDELAVVGFGNEKVPSECDDWSP